MHRALNYEDAVRILGGDETKLTKLFGQASIATLIAAGGFNFVEAAQEIIRSGNELVAGISNRLRGVNRLTRTERLTAAHTVIVITAYFEALHEVMATLAPGRSLDLTARDQIFLATRIDVEAEWRSLIRVLSNTSLALPPPTRTRTTAPLSLEPYYFSLSMHIGRFAAGLALWDELNQTQRDYFTDQLDSALPIAAAVRYSDLYRRLAVDCPEFGVWVDLAEHESTRAVLGRSLSGLEELLAGMADGQLPDKRRTALSTAYRAALERPVISSNDLPAGLRAPTLSAGYIDHRYRTARLSPGSEPARESWWDEHKIHTGIDRFLAAYLTLPSALEAPLLVLGQPGSGKSMLTRVLAARLPSQDFLPVRVELRQVPAEADLQTQIETAIRDATGETLPWPRLVESADGALPVVMLDGFDEMLQATGVHQTDFLMRVAAFQEREADQGRPVAVIVTSRTAVADRAALPEGSTALLLQPFEPDQIADWLEIWGELNEAVLVERDLRPLPTEVALQHGELARQPLLLLMLALYDSHTNTLQHHSDRLSGAELYEHLLKDFARREVRKHRAATTEPELEAAVETELLHLSVVAFAMFNRGNQWIEETSLNADFAALLAHRTDPGRRGSLRTPLSAAQSIVGRFFFVHESHATNDGRRLQTYEFLHATFGEFLVARLVFRVLANMADRESAAAYAVPGTVDDGLLHALLSFTVLTARAPVITFLAEMTGRLAPDRRATVKAMLLRLHSDALSPRRESAYAGYEPRESVVPARCSAWSANLVVLSVVGAGSVTAGELFPDHAADPALGWHDQAMMWRAQLSWAEWDSLVQTLALERTWDGERCDIRLWLDDGTFEPAPPDLRWTYATRRDAPMLPALNWPTHMADKMLRKSNFTTGRSDDVMTHALRPIAEAFPTLANRIHRVTPNRTVSATHALLAVTTAPLGGGAAGTAYSDLMHIMVATARDATPTDQEAIAYVKSALAAFLIAAELDALPEPDLNQLILMFQAAPLSLGDPGIATLMKRLTELRQRATASAEL